uniref:Serine carboxypeptidase n=1 Tax=Rhipicephalus appendiculatus TaxID=34631 RepID=A0A131YBU5_RHIAP
MLSSWIWSLSVLAVGLQHLHGSHADEDVSHPETPPNQESQPIINPTDTEPLFLTPLIDDCNYTEAREKSKIPSFLLANVTAHSGYITVNKTANSNLFFLLTEVEGNKTAPLLLWTQGGPGLSALFGLLLENGPFAFDIYANGSPNVHPRYNTLQKDMSVLYLDLPVGAGFSFTNDTVHGYPTKLEDIVLHVVEFLRQFLSVFSEYTNRDFYLAGESYGARYSVAIASWMLNYPQNVSLALKGVIGGNGFLGPVLYVADSSEFLYQMSMLDNNGRTTFANKFVELRSLAESGNTTLKLYALQQLFETIFAKQNATPTLFQNLTLYNDHASPLKTERPLFMIVCYLFLSMNTTKIMLHAGADAHFQIYNEDLVKNFASDWLRDITDMNEHVLNKTNVLLYTGQIDALFPSVNQRTYFKRLNWTYRDQYKAADRYPWKPYEKYYGFAGYMTTVETFKEIVLLGMSHYGAVDKPDETYYLIREFVNNASNVKTPPKAPETTATS